MTSAPSVSPDSLTCHQIYLNYGESTLPKLQTGFYNLTVVTPSTSYPFEIYCVFDYVNRYSWTLIETHQYLMRVFWAMSKPFDFDLYGDPFNVNAMELDVKKAVTIPTTDSGHGGWRPRLEVLKSISSQSTHIMATCNFDHSQTRDFFIIDKVQADYDILISKTNW